MVGFAAMNGGEFVLAQPQRSVLAEPRCDVCQLVVQHRANGIHDAGGERRPIGRLAKRVHHRLLHGVEWRIR